MLNGYANSNGALLESTGSEGSLSDVDIDRAGSPEGRHDSGWLLLDGVTPIQGKASVKIAH
jgi:hypothetical protein